jgi:hypothetical protein
MDREVQGHPKVCGKGLDAETFSDSLHDTSKLGLSGRQSDVLLGGGPMLEDVGAQEDHSP